MSTRRARDLGQNFLVDRNLLDVIERLAGLDREDVVLEIGGGLGVLSERLAQRAGHVHVVEVDPRLEPELRATLAPFANVTLHLADALELDLASLRPEPTRVVANLPYGIAATAILRTIDELPTVTRWMVMVQREVGERLAAAPATAAYGIPSVLAQLACEVKGVAPRLEDGLPPGTQRRFGPRRSRTAQTRCRRGAADVRARRLCPPAQGSRALASAGAGRR